MMLANYSRVRLKTDRFRSEGITEGDFGYIIEIYGQKYEIEFSNESGETIALVVVSEEDIEVCEPNSVFEDPDELTRRFGVAVREALLDHKRARNPVAVWRADGKVAIVPPDKTV